MAAAFFGGSSASNNRNILSLSTAQAYLVHAYVKDRLAALFVLVLVG